MNYKQFMKDITVPSNEEADEILVHQTALAMEVKLKQKRSEGRGGWWEDENLNQQLWEMVNDHLDRCKDDPHQLIDCINLLAMIRLRIGMGVEK